MRYVNPILNICRWFNKAKPAATLEDLNTQLGVHFEEVTEMLVTLHTEDSDVHKAIDEACEAMNKLSQLLKTQTVPVTIKTETRAEFLDSICDQIVTAVGVGVYAKMNVAGGLDEVSESNDSKFDPITGLPILNEHGKIMKGPAYRQADLTAFI